MLGGMAAKWRWKARQRAAGRPTDRPNLVCGPVQVCWEKFCRYWEIEKREIPMIAADGQLVMDPERMLEAVDENTICVVPTFGVTYHGLYEMVQPLAAALDRLQAIDPDTDPSEAHRDTRIFHTAESPMAELENLTYRYPAQPEAVFSDFSYQFSGADGGTGWHWICGASGRGKSTLIALLSGQLQPGSGRIILSLADSSRLALMPQRIDILKASLRDNLCLNRQHSDEAIRAALALVELGQWAENLPQGLDTWLGDGEWQPSGGESKRIGLARVILMEPQIILLDEPAAGMDAALAQRIFAGLAEHWQDKLVIANTHDRGLILSGQKVLELDAT